MTNLSSDNDNDSDSIFVSFTSRISSFISYFTTYHFSFERSSSQTSFFEEMMQHEEQKWISSSIHLTLNLYFERTKKSRTNYVRLREILQLIEKIFSDFLKNLKIIHNFSLKLDTLKRQIRRHMSLLKLHRKTFTVVVKKQFSLIARKKEERRRQKIERLAWQYWYDSVDLISTILSTIKLREKMHFEMTQYVNEFIEFWHFVVWESSIRTSFENVVFFSKNNFILSNDFLIFETNENVLNFNVIIDRIIFIDRNHRFYVETQNEICVSLQFVVDWEYHLLKNFEDENSHELIVIENSNFELSFNQLHNHLNIYINRNYDDAKNESEKLYTDERIYVRRVYNTSSKIIRSIVRLHSTRAKLKISHFDRNHVKRFFSQTHLFLLYLLFIDEFEIHRNMYRSLKAFYLIFANLSYEKRRKIINVFTLTLESHDVVFENVVKVFFKDIKQLNRDFALFVNDIETEICFFVMKLIDDMSQQIENEEFAHHNAQKECRFCFCFKTLKENLQFDIVQEDRYHFEIVRQREHAKQLVDENRKDFLKKIELQLKSFVIVRLCFAFDLMRTRTYDVSHSKWRKLKRTLHNFFVITMLFKQENIQYLRHFQSFQYSSDWSRIQNSIFYMRFWLLSKTKRVFILFFLIFRCHAIVRWFRLSYFQTVNKIMKIEIFSLKAIVQVLKMIAYSNILIESQHYISFHQLHNVVLRVRKVYQDLIKYDMMSKKVFFIFTIIVEENQKVDNLANDDDNEDAKDNLILFADEANHNHMTKILQIVVDFDFDFDFSSLSFSQFTVAFQRKKKRKRDRKFKTNKFENFFNLFNVHFDLHFVDNAREFETIMNFNVLIEEFKHMSSAFFSHSLSN